jgi:hypothetical protein
MFVCNEIIENSLFIHPAYVGDSLDKIRKPTAGQKDVTQNGEKWIMYIFSLCLFLNYIQSCLKFSGSGKLLYMFLAQVDGRFTVNQTTPPFFIPFSPFKKKNERKKR